MHYRDLIPCRLGGAIIASHIRIPDAGPVPDKVHYHVIGFQLIYCYAGWVRLVYEDQGPPLILHAGDCVIQPPRIRHRFLESSKNLQVDEIGVPAEHITTIDWHMELPTPCHRTDREWEGQRFVLSLANDAIWNAWRVPRFEARDTGIADRTKGVATVRVARPVEGNREGGEVTSHDSEILFTCKQAYRISCLDFIADILSSCSHWTLHAAWQWSGAHDLTEGDAYTLPPHHKSSLTNLSEDLTLLEVSLPASFLTTLHVDEQLP